ncbi:MAG: hypothetical protein DI616_15665 [Paracoccus denitrificans]|uniref:Uncharacterized protein n=1 Tax=Paracoccus denitrificans TaxID=266 RepID=A0A533I285_PARDE|nr:MAG: hypothetical protein DI616_15665 [Paracoccus denitrificans]
MKFGYTIDGQECVIDVYHYRPYCPMVITGTGFGDAIPPEDEEFEFSVLDLHGLPWHELSDKLDTAEISRIKAFYKKLRGLKC